MPTIHKDDDLVMDLAGTIGGAVDRLIQATRLEPPVELKRATVQVE